MDLVSRLKQYLDSRQISVTQFADVCGIPRPTASQLLAGRNKKVSDEIINKIHNFYPDLSILWLMFGEGEMTANAINADSQPHIAGDDNDTAPLSANANTGFDGGEFVVANQAIANANTNNKPTKPQNNEFRFTNSNNSETQTATNPNDDSYESHTFEFEDANKDGEQSDNQDDFNLESALLNKSAGKRVTGIVVYYDDQTYESFVPDPEHLHPFIRR